MEAGSHSGIARLVQQSLGTSALFPSCVLIIIYLLLLNMEEEDNMLYKR
jgi:hypothetical protein